MLSFAEATGRIRERAHALDAEEVSLLEAQGRVLRSTQMAIRQLPPWDNSAMDGYAVRREELPGRLPLVGVVAAGDAATAELKRGTCLKIMTGAPVPAGADSVVMREQVTEEEDKACFAEQPKLGSHIRRAGEDVASNSVLLSEGEVLGPGELAILAAQGIARVPVTKRPQVVILSTGDELVPLGVEPKDGQIINSNNITLAAQVHEAGATPVDAGIACDSLKDTVRALQACRDYDVLITSGGVSVGDYDHVKKAYEEVGIEIVFWKVAIKPGKPVAFGIRDRGANMSPQLVFGLPGNPASSLVSFELFVRPLLRALLGHKKVAREQLSVKLTQALKKVPGRTNFVRATLERKDGEVTATPLKKQGSGMLRSMVSVDCLLMLDADGSDFPVGSKVPAVVLRGCR